MVKMKESGIGLLGLIPEDWKVTKLKYEFDFGKGLPITKDNLIEEGLPVISYGQIHSKLNNGTSINPSLLRFVKPYYKFTNPQSQVFKGDFIFADTSEDLEGCGNAVLKCDEDDLYAGYHSIIMHAKRSEYSKYLAYLFLTNEWRSQLRSKVSGVKVLSVTQTIFKFASIILPPLETQKRIVDFLDRKCTKIDSLRNDIQKQIEVLEQYKKSVITEVVTKGINPDAKMKDTNSKWIPKVPEHWKMDKLKFNLTVHEIKGYGDKEVLSLYRELGIVPKNSRDDNHNVTSEDTSKYKYVRKGDFVINKMKAWQGSVAVSDFEGIVSPAYYVYEFTNEKYDKKYFHHLMRNKILADEFRRISGGIREGQWDLDRVQFENMYLPVPPKNEQVEIANLIESKYGNIEKVIESKQQQLEKLEEYKKSLIFEYVTGKREV